MEDLTMENKCVYHCPHCSYTTVSLEDFYAHAQKCEEKIAKRVAEKKKSEQLEKDIDSLTEDYNVFKEKVNKFNKTNTDKCEAILTFKILKKQKLNADDYIAKMEDEYGSAIQNWLLNDLFK